MIRIYKSWRDKCASFVVHACNFCVSSAREIFFFCPARCRGAIAGSRIEDSSDIRRRERREQQMRDNKEKRGKRSRRNARRQNDISRVTVALKWTRYEALRRVTLCVRNNNLFPRYFSPAVSLSRKKSQKRETRRDINAWIASAREEPINSERR